MHASKQARRHPGINAYLFGCIVHAAATEREMRALMHEEIPLFPPSSGVRNQANTPCAALARSLALCSPATYTNKNKYITFGHHAKQMF
jgi:hypothetical protein